MFLFVFLQQKMGKLKRGRGKIGRTPKRRRNKKTEDADLPSHQVLTNQVVNDHSYSTKSSEDYSTKSSEDVFSCDHKGDFDNCDCIVHECTEQNLQIREESEDEADEFYVIIDGEHYRHEAHQNVDNVIHTILLASLERLKNAVDEHENFVVQQDFSVIKSTRKLNLIQFYELDNSVAIKTCLTIDHHLKPLVTVHGKPLPLSHDVYKTISKVHSAALVIELLKSINSYCVCIGNSDEHCIRLFDPVKSKKAFLDNNVTIDYNSTIRSVSCPLLSKKSRCQYCQTYRATLRDKIINNNKSKEKMSNFRSSKPNAAMSREELEQKTRDLKSQNKNLAAQNKRLRSKITKLIQESHKLTEEDSAEVEVLVKETQPEIEKQWPDANCFQRIFWQEQIKYNELKSKSSMRWHPLIIKWALLIRSKSSKAYQTMRELGFLNLPSERTLYDYRHCVPSRTGFIPEVVNQLIEECTKKGMYNTEWNNCVGILQDEIKIKDDLVYCPSSGQLIGFVDLDDTSNQIMQFQNSIDNSEHKLASSMLVLMVRGATTNLKFPFASFATRGLHANQLQTIIMRAIELLEIDCGLKCLYVSCDGAGQNRRFFEMNKTEVNDEPCNWMPNPYAEEERPIYFISDVPHLLKTARNCFSNSGSHMQTRNLWKDGKNILWTQITNLFAKEEEQLFVKCPKLTRNHIDLNPYSRMKVNYAAQIFSESVASLLEEEYGEEVSETCQFIRHMNRFFDCLNTRNLYEGKHKRNPDLNAYTKTNDPRFDYLLNDFLGYFETWRKSVESRVGNYTDKDRSAMQLSYQTIDGLKISVRSIVQCVQYLLNLGAPFVLTEVFNQDILEQHFGHYRQKGGLNDAPTVFSARHTMTSLRVVDSVALAPLRGNTKRMNCTPEFIESPLPRKKSRPGPLL